MSDSINMVAAALAYARRGIAVFPPWPVLPTVPPMSRGFLCGCGKLSCNNQGKHPLGSLARNGLLDATTDERIIRHWWGARADANIAGATGSILIVDIDPRHGGSASILERRFGPMPPTWRAATGGGGEHLYFASPNSTIGNSAAKLGPGIDTRGKGGYALLPPSLHISGRRYSWQLGCNPKQIALAPLPSAIAAALTDQAKAGRNTPSAEWRTLASADVAEGQRNASLARFAGHLLRRYVDPFVVMELLASWNACRCKPPLDGEEIQTILNSIAGRELRRRQAQCR